MLISTGGLDANTIKSLKRQYFFAPLALWYLKHCNYEKLKPKLIRLGMSHLRGEGPEEAAYAQDMFETIFREILFRNFLIAVKMIIFFFRNKDIMNC